jgi:hypothetical protein
VSWLHPEDFSVGFTSLPEPLRGAWTFDGFPLRVEIIGRSFVRSDTWSAPLPGVVRQYREDVPRNSMHLEVHDNGLWSIDHVDAANPERGLVLEHALRDVVQTPLGALVLVAGVLGVSAGISFALTRRWHRPA